jgi:hypothetical protein
MPPSSAAFMIASQASSNSLRSVTVPILWYSVSPIPTMQDSASHDMAISST